MRGYTRGVVPAVPNRPRVTVITPVYNGERYLGEVLAAVRAQTFDDWEQIVVDDGSTDATWSILSEAVSLDPRLRIVQQANAGEATAVNHAYALARGDYIVVVNADDPPFPKLLERLVSMLDASPSVVVAYPDWLKIDATGSTIKSVRTLEYSREALIGDFRCIPGPGALIRRSALGDQQLRRPQFRFVSDYDLWLRLSLVGSMKRCPETLARWRSHETGATAVGQGQALADEFLAVIREFFAQSNLPSDVRQLERQAHAMSCYYAGFQRVFDPSVPGRRLMLRSVFTPFRRKRSYETIRRSPLAMGAPFLRIIASPLFRRYGDRLV